MREVKVFVEGKIVIVQYDEDSWRVKDNPFCETWPGDWSMRKVREAVQKYDAVIERRKRGGPIKFST
ncbi:hypothetical protein D1B31_18515 [Neobacillus notoginsengisoli]|uniref:Uncharacterized protein n=1 Tax=Neobacillus notoginsengisoli TaxID=1578198 RepID=A0A417YQF8_9BACI|nr:hypothetical protein [Neobacillus notoginsengisoli]RHW36072.1 hypothetical protein D1B31_18515 [Neobacillus notoginsengisoli]